MTQNPPSPVHPELISRAAGLAVPDGVATDAWPGLTVFHATAPIARMQIVYRPCICFVVQGHKRLLLGRESLDYGPSDYLVVSLPMPVEGAVIEASATRPCIGLLLEFDPMTLGRLVLEIADEGHALPPTSEPKALGVFTGRMTGTLRDVLLRFVETLSSPLDRRMLGPGLVREILYRVLTGEQGQRFAALATDAGSGHRVARAIRYLEQNIDQPLDVPSIARVSGMAVSTLHHAFKHVTTMSPIQYLKKLRLHRARALLIAGASVGEASDRVGYASSSQFSREFKRLFGVVPSRVTAGPADSVRRAP